MSETATPGAPPRALETEHEFFAKTGPVPTAWNELRRFPRFYFRSCVRALIYPPAAARCQQPNECFLLTSDLSRGGISILCNTLLYPGQRVDVWLQDGSLRSLEVLWCKRIGERCYTTGMRFRKSDDATSPPEQEA